MTERNWNITIPESAYQKHLDIILELREKVAKIKKIATKHHNERYDTDWDSMQKALNKIYKLVNK